MTRILFGPAPAAALSLSLSLLAAGCNPTEPVRTAVAGDEAEAERLLDEPTGDSELSLRAAGFTRAAVDDRRVPVFLGGETADRVVSADDMKRFIRTKLTNAYRLTPASDFAVVKDERDDLGRRTVRLQQTHHGVPVVHGELVLSISGEDRIEAVLGTAAPDLELDVTPALSGEAAIIRAIGELAPGQPPVTHEGPELMIYAPRDPGQKARTPELVYRAVVEYAGAEGFALEEIFAGANEGRVIARHPRMFDALSRSIYTLNNTVCLTSSSQNTLPGTSVFNEGGSSTDSIAQAAYTNTGNAYWYYRRFHGRDSYDGAGAALRSTVHVKFFSACDPNNAAWIDAPYNQMVYGDGDNSLFFPTTGAIDVTAHELTHAVTSRTSNLTYQDESGALNEAMSDIFGNGAEAWFASGGSSAGNPSGGVSSFDETWLVGEEIAGPNLSGGALRFMNDPTADGYSTDYYPERLIGWDDHGYVHANSGIANLAFYLLSESGAHPQGKTSNFVQGVTLPVALQIFYRANSTLLTASSTFQDARYATAQAAEDIYGACAPQSTAVHTAWTAVGVPGSVGFPCIVRPPSEVEPNNTPAQANTVAQSVVGYLTAGNPDYFQKTMSAGTKNIALRSPQGSNFDLYVWDGRTLVASSTKPAGILDAVSVRLSASHLLTFEVRLISGASSTAFYLLYAQN